MNAVAVIGCAFGGIALGALGMLGYVVWTFKDSYR